MKISKSLNPALLVILMFALLGCNDLGSGTLGTLVLGGGADDDDDTVAGDDDTASGDDDTASGDDDTASGDDDTAPSGPHELTGRYDGDFLMFVDLPGGGPDLEEACEGEIDLDVEPDGSYRASADCDWQRTVGPDYEFDLEGSVTTSLQFNGAVSGSNSWNQQVSDSPSLGYIKQGFIKIEWEGMTPGQGQMSRSYQGVAWMEVD